MSERVILLFGAKWCGNCGIQKAQLDNAGVEYTYLDVDSEQGSEEANVQGVRGLPTTIIFRDNVEVRRDVGIMTTKEIKES